MLSWELSSRPPFEEFDGYQILPRIKSGHHEKPVDGSPSEYVKLYSKCWTKALKKDQPLKLSWKH